MIERYVRALGAGLDRTVYALFSRHADRARHDRDRDRYRGAALSIGFDTYLARVYGLSWVVGICVGLVALGFATTLDPAVFEAFDGAVSTILPGDITAPSLPNLSIVVAAGALSGGAAKRGTIALGGAHLRWRVNARRAAIEQSLPGAVRYLRALADGSEGRRVMLRSVADRDAYGETATAFERVLERAALTGSLDTGLRNVARETPSRELLSPFLLKFRDHGNQGSDSLRRYLRTESRILSRRQSRSRERAGGYLELLAELFVLLLVLPVALVVLVTVASVLAPGLSRPVPVFAPAFGSGEPTVRALLMYGSIGFVLTAGAVTTALVARLRPRAYGRRYERPPGPETLSTALSNPASAAFAFAFPAVALAWGLWMVGETPANVVLLGYAAYGLPVGVVAIYRSRLDDRKDREMRDFVHAVAGQLSLGQPFVSAVETASRDVSIDVLQDDIDDLSFRLRLTTGTAETGTRREALDRFTARVGTPLTTQTIGLVTDALMVGSDVETTFETLQTEIGSLYHQRQELRSAMFVYAAVGWTTALLVIGAVVAANTLLLDGVAQLSTVPQASGIEIAPDAVEADRDGWRLYLVTQATVIACGWFSGVASRGRYAALFHSAALVVICYGAFAGFGAI